MFRRLLIVIGITLGIVVIVNHQQAGPGGGPGAAPKQSVAARVASHPTAPVAEMPLFTAVHHAPRGVHTDAAVLTLKGTVPQPNTGQPVDTGTYPLRHIAVDGSTGTVYGITTHRFGWIDPEDGFIEIEPPEYLPELSWPDGLAFDPESRSLLLTGRGVAYRWYLDDDHWEEADAFSRLDTVNLAFDSASGTYVGLLRQHGDKMLKRLVRVDFSGVRLQEVELTPAIPFIDRHNTSAQLLHHPDGLLLFVAQHSGDNGKAAPAQLYRINPETGANFRLVAGQPASEASDRSGELAGV